jgi:predicted phosphodiesterase
MKIAFISDIHSNYDALKKTAEFIKNSNAEAVYCAGDIIGYGAQPNECVEALRGMRVLCVRGNHEDYLLGEKDFNGVNRNAREAISWHQDMVTENNMKYIKALKYSEVIKEHSIKIVHGSPFCPENFNYVMSRREVVEAFLSFEEQICLIGHTHIPAAFRFNEESGLFQYRFGSKVHVEKGYRYIINIGSVGQPRDGIPQAGVCIYDSDSGIFAEKRFDYDVHSAQKKILDAGLPPTLAYRLAYGL